MAFITGEDEYGEVSLTVFPNVYKRFNNIEIGDIINIFGKVEKRFDKYQLIIDKLQVLD